MAKFNEETIQMLSELSAIHCSDSEAQKLSCDLQKILDYIQQLEEIDTSNTEPCYQVLEEMHNVMREDECEEPSKLEEFQKVFLKNSPSQIGSMIKTPPVIQQKK